MGISFKVSKTGRRFRPRPLPQSDNNSVVTAADDDQEDVVLGISKESNRIAGAKTDYFSSLTRKSAFDISDRDGDTSGISETEVSITLSLFPDGYSIGKPSEGESVNQTYTEIPKLLHPYDRASETLFSAVEAGRLPGDIFDDIPCKYVNGMLVCEVRDYRKCFSEAGANLPSTIGSPIIHKVRLRMSLENVVKDIPSISDGAWTYGDLMEVESRILKALQPKLCLDPTPKLDRLGENLTATKLNLAMCNMRKRLRQIPDVTVTNNIHGKKVCIDRVPESSRFGDSGSVQQQPIQENLPTQNNGPNSMIALRSNSFGVNVSVPSSPLASNPSKYQMGVGSPRIVQDPRSGSVLNASSASHPGQDMVITYSDNASPGAAVLHGRRDSQDMQPNSNKRSRHTSIGAFGNQQQHVGSPMDSFHGQDPHWKNTILQQQSLARGIQYANTGMQKYPLPIFEGGLDQEPGSVPFTQGIKYGLKEEPVETERLDKPELGQIRNEMHGLESELNQTDSQQSRLSQRIPQQLIRSPFPQTPWNNLGQPLENNLRKEDPYQKRKVVQSPRVSTGGIPQSPLSSKSGEFSSGSIGPQVGAAVTSGYLPPQKEKSVNISVPPIGGGTSLTSSANDSMQRQHQAQIAAKRRSNSLPKTPAMSGVGSPASVNNMTMPINVSSPVGTPPLADPVMIDRFSKIDMVTVRFQLNCKKTKVDEYAVGKIFSAQQLSLQLSSDLNNENFKDESCKMPLSTSLAGGNMNICKTRALTFLLTEGNVQGNGFPIVPKARTRLIMSEKPNDGTVAFHIGDIEDAQYLAAEDYLPTLPNTHTADLLATQFCSLITREGHLVEDLVQPKPIPPIHATSNQPNAPGSHPYNAAAELQQYSEGVSGPPSNDNSKPSNSGNHSLNPSNNLQGSRMLAPGSVQGLQISQGFLSAASMPPRPQQPDPIASLQQPQLQSQQQLMQSQLPQFQRSALALPSNPMLNTFGQNSNMQLNNYMANKPSHLQLQMIQQQQQQQQQQLLQRKMMSLGNASMGNMANNMVGFGGVGNMMGMGGVRGVGGTGISAPMASITGMGNMAQNPLNLNPAPNISNVISQQLRPGMNPLQNIMSKMRMQNRGNMPGVPQASISGNIAGARQINTGAAGLPMLGPAMNRGNINPMQRPMGQMGPPKLMTGNNSYMSQQQLQMQQQLPQQQQQQQQQQLQQQHENTSPLQAVVTPPQVGSPSNMGMPQQVNQPTNQQQQQQQLQQASPQQMSQRTPMSPQLSSGAVHTMSAGNQEACPASPQLSSQTLGSVGSITNSPMELQGVNKSN